jgi:hypothetical protein
VGVLMTGGTLHLSFALLPETKPGFASVGGREMIVRLPSIRNADPSAPAASKSGVRNVLTRRRLGLAVALLTTIPVYCQEKPRDLAAKSIEDLMNVDVTSVSTGARSPRQLKVAQRPLFVCEKPTP